MTVDVDVNESAGVSAVGFVVVGSVVDSAAAAAAGVVGSGIGVVVVGAEQDVRCPPRLLPW